MGNIPEHMRDHDDLAAPAKRKRRTGPWIIIGLLVGALIGLFAAAKLHFWG